jgi:hypothetical protein
VSGEFWFFGEGEDDDGRRDAQTYYALALRHCLTFREIHHMALWANLAAKASRRNDGLNYTAWQFSIFIECGDLNREIAAKLLSRACEANGYLAKDGAGVVREVITRVLDLENWQPASAKREVDRRTDK